MALFCALLESDGGVTMVVAKVAHAFGQDLPAGNEGYEMISSEIEGLQDISQYRSGPGGNSSAIAICTSVGNLHHGSGSAAPASQTRSFALQPTIVRSTVEPTTAV